MKKIILLSCLLLFPSLTLSKDLSPSSLSFLSDEEHIFYLAQIIASNQNDKAAEELPKLGKLNQSNKKRKELLAAVLLFHQGRYQEASLAFANVNIKALEDYLKYYEALSLSRMNQSQAALKQLSQIKSPSLALNKKINRLKVFLDCLESKDPSEETTLPESDEIYKSKFMLAKCYLFRGEKAKAFAGFREIFVQAPEGPLVKASEKFLGSQLSGSDYQNRSVRLANLDLHINSAAYLEKAYQLSGNAPSMLEALAAQEFKARNYSRAAELYEQLGARKHPDLIQQLAQSYSRSDQFSKALQIYRSLYQEAPSEKLLFKLAFLEEDSGAYVNARKLYLQVMQEYPNSSYKNTIAWRVFWSSYRLGEMQTALNYLNDLETNFPRHERKESFNYWKARIHEKMGQKKLAQKFYNQVQFESSTSFYSYLAKKRLEKNMPLQNLPQSSRFPGKKPHLWSPRELEKRDPLLAELAYSGLWEDFLTELKTKEVGTISQMMKSSNSGLDLGYLANGSLNQQFPFALGPWVVSFAQARSLPSSLVWAIMRQESRFKPHVGSQAGALGLMQIIPQTGQEIHSKLGRSNFQREDLLRPLINVEFGVDYLSSLYQKQNGNLVYTIASYNAGPDAVDRWKKSRGHLEWDEWVEEIPYKETRKYVKRVMENFYTYEAIGR